MKQQLIEEMVHVMQEAIEKDDIKGWRALIFVAMHKVIVCSADEIVRGLALNTALNMAYKAQDLLLEIDGGKYYDAVFRFS